jgi:hypothetical protein
MYFWEKIEMEKVISFTKRAQVRALTAGEYLGYTIQLLIQEILNQVVASEKMDRAIVHAAQKYPTIAETFFDIDPTNVAASFSLKEPLLFPEQNPVVSFSFFNTNLSQFLSEGFNSTSFSVTTFQIPESLPLCLCTRRFARRRTGFGK